MLGRDADAIFWLFRYIERSENLAVFLDTFFNVMLTDSDSLKVERFFLMELVSKSEEDFEQLKKFEFTKMINLLLRNDQRPDTLFFLLRKARENARVARTSLSSDLWKAINDYWLFTVSIKKTRIKERDMPRIISEIKIKNSLIRGAFNGSLLRNEIFYFGALGTYMERAYNTARVLTINISDLSENGNHGGDFQKKKLWEVVLKVLQAYSSYGWLNKGQISEVKVANFLLRDARMPRSLFYCSDSVYRNLLNIVQKKTIAYKSLRLSRKIRGQLVNTDIGDLEKIHHRARDYILINNKLSREIENDFNFIEH